MSSGRRGIYALTIGKKIIVYGGLNNSNSDPQRMVLKNGEEYDPSTNNWTMLAPMTLARSYFSIVKPNWKPSGDPRFSLNYYHLNSNLFKTNKLIFGLPLQNAVAPALDSHRNTINSSLFRFCATNKRSTFESFGEPIRTYPNSFSTTFWTTTFDHWSSDWFLDRGDK